VVASWIAGTRPDVRTLGFLGAALGGILLMFQGPFQEGSSRWTGDALALTASLSLAAYLLVAHRLQRTMQSLPAVALVFTLCGALLLLTAGLVGDDVTGFDRPTWLLFAGLALFPSLGGHAVFNGALRYVPAPKSIYRDVAKLPAGHRLAFDGEQHRIHLVVTQREV